MKRIITCTDGTWDKPGDKDKGKSLDSNVCIMYDAIEPFDNENKIQQIKVYDTGVGSGYTLENKLSGGITGAGLDKKIKDVYTFLVLNYKPEDHIYLFGFSRGAYTARSLAGFIRNCGILTPDNLHLLDKAFELYRDRNDYTAPNSDMMVSFRREYAIEDITPIHFIGVWDTVGSLGIPFGWFDAFNREKYKFHDVTLSSTVINAYHALAVDERRELFEPSLWQLSKENRLKNSTQLEQRWFAGVHCNVGGGYADRGLSNNTLHWMAKKASATGLVLNNFKLGHHKPDYLAKKEESYTGIYHLTGKIWRKIESSLGSNQFIDDSVHDRIKADPTYRPLNIETATI